MAQIDHIVIGAATLEAGGDFIERLLGVRPEPGGRHEGVGTHNLLLGLGPEHYLEVIAPDPGQPEPAHSRPFGLDDPGVRTMLEAEPHLVGWVARTPALDAVIGRLGPRGGTIVAMRRGDLAWRLAMPPPNQAFDTLIPTLIQWDGPAAVTRLADSGCRLVGLEAEHPEATAVRAELSGRGLEEALTVRQSSSPRLLARLRKADGSEVVLTGR